MNVSNSVYSYRTNAKKKSKTAYSKIDNPEIERFVINKDLYKAKLKTKLRESANAYIQYLLDENPKAIDYFEERFNWEDFEDVDDLLYDYGRIIKNPMWFNKIIEKLNTDSYEYFSEFFNDLKLIITNSYKFNITSSEIGKHTIKLEKFIMKTIEEYFLDILQKNSTDNSEEKKQAEVFKDFCEDKEEEDDLIVDNERKQEIINLLHYLNLDENKIEIIIEIFTEMDELSQKKEKIINYDAKTQTIELDMDNMSYSEFVTLYS